MQIDKTIGKWFQEIEDALENLSTEKKQTNIFFLIVNSLPTFGNYLNTTLLILKNERRLPAKALLRVTGQFISRVIWVLKSENEDERQNRLERWKKDSYCEAKRYNEEIIEFYSKDDERAVVAKRIEGYIEEINKLEERKIKRLPQWIQIFEQAFGKSILAAGMYSQYHHAIHPDILVLTATVSENKTDTICEGDTKESIDSLKQDCLTQAYIFFDEVCKYYGFTFKEMADEYQAIMCA